MKRIKFLIVALLFMAFAIGSGSDGSSASTDSKKGSFMDSADATQHDFFEFISYHDSVFETRTSGNEIQFQEMCNDKNDALKKYFSRSDINKFTVQNWIGEVEEIQALSNGGGLKVMCNSEGSSLSFVGTTFYLNTSNAYDDALLSYTSIKKSSDLYKKLATLKKGAIIKFSGKFIKSPSYYRRSYVISNSEYANTPQDYLFQFTEVDEISKAK